MNSGDTYTVWAMVTNPGDATQDIGYAGSGMSSTGRYGPSRTLRQGGLTGLPDELGGCDYSSVPPLVETAPKDGEPSDFA